MQLPLLFFVSSAPEVTWNQRSQRDWPPALRGAASCSGSRACERKGVRECMRSPDSALHPREAGRRLLPHHGGRSGAGPGTLFCSPAFLQGWGLSYYAIFQELLDPAFRFSSSPLPWRGPWSGPGVSSNPVRGRPSGGGQVPLPATLPPHVPRPPPSLGISGLWTHGSLTDLGPCTWKIPFLAE